MFNFIYIFMQLHQLASLMQMSALFDMRSTNKIKLSEHSIIKA